MLCTSPEGYRRSDWSVVGTAVLRKLGVSACHPGLSYMGRRPGHLGLKVVRCQTKNQPYSGYRALVISGKD
ncbi:hypothetical protein GUJ93_ZPchr0004g38204 [Zizania palustris]|uniref:Uncharacterized protein n=1 Tax=Zizania palustris TaxID=103762 RepID=A0A8J5T237_ZIZPA|nr:hypothetical protein GUJ93_ZPchr0004g38204 [Zizania palustris]